VNSIPKSFKAHAWPATLNTSSSNLIEDFFLPCLQQAVRYDRAVGFFSSGWLRIAAKGMVKFAAAGGKARWVTSPILSEPDWEALRTGSDAHIDPLLHDALSRNIDDLEEALEKQTLSALAWLVADEVLTFKLALPRNKLERGDFHDKFGVFADSEGCQISFNGSYNDSIQGTRNYESIKIFCSWQQAFEPLVQEDAERFEKLWSNSDPNVRVFNLPEAAREHIVNLRKAERPYCVPEWVRPQEVREPQHSHQTEPTLPENIQLRDYQNEAIESWFDHDCQGIFEMATGTGKTITALAASIRLFEQESRLAIIIACPYKHLVTQWADDVGKFGFNKVLVFGSAGINKCANKLLDFTAGHIDHLVVLTTHDTFYTSRFASLIQERPLPMLLIVDEVHDVGSTQRRQGLLQEYQYRLGLSATPSRWFDEEGTRVLFDYFRRTVFEFPLAKAIPKFLVPYEYYPFFVELTDEELAEYKRMTQQIIQRASKVEEGLDDDLLSLFMIKRHQIIVNANNKYHCFEQVLDLLESQMHTLVYCSPEQIDKAQKILNKRGIIQSRFTGQESLKTRTNLLQSFSDGAHKMLVAMKCLDQGVDVPATRTAILLASSGNPKEFIQRRGRVLRRSPGKKKAVIYDIIVVPILHGKMDAEEMRLERKILKRELLRYNEFAELALNRVYALNQIGPIKRKYLLI